MSGERPHDVSLPVPDRGAGDEERFRSVFESRYSSIHSYVLRRLGPSSNDIADVTAQIFAVAWRRRAQIPQPPGDLPWLYGVGRKIVSRHRRSVQRRRNLEERLVNEAHVSQDPTVSPSPETLRVRTAIGRLRARDQELLRLVLWEGLSHAQAGDVVGCSANAVAIRLHKVRRRLYAELAKESAQRGRSTDDTDGGGEEAPKHGSR